MGTESILSGGSPFLNKGFTLDGKPPPPPYLGLAVAVEMASEAA